MRRQFESADVALVATCQLEPNCFKWRYAPECRSALDIGRKAAAVHSFTLAWRQRGILSFSTAPKATMVLIFSVGGKGGRPSVMPRRTAAICVSVAWETPTFPICRLSVVITNPPLSNAITPLRRRLYLASWTQQRLL